MQHGLMAALAAGMALVTTGCGLMAEPAPTGDDLYRDGEERYVAYATTMHSVIMAIHEGDWDVDQGSFGASPIPCRIGGEPTGYAFSWARVIEPGTLDVDAVVAAATAAFEAADMTVETATYGEGDRQEINVIGSGGDVGRGVVAIRPGESRIRVSAAPGCFPGDAGDLSDMVFAGPVYDGASRRLPPLEGPESQPQFYFPEEGSPIYTNEDGTLVEPQPAQADLPIAPYGH